MNARAFDRDPAWLHAVQTAVLFAVDPIGVGGIVVRAFAGPVRERWLALLDSLLPPRVRRFQVPVQIAEDRLLGGLDLAATLRAGKPVAQRGLLAQAGGDVVVLSMAERLSRTTLAQIAACMDAGGVRLERDGIARFWPSRFGVLAFDESLDDEPPLAVSLADRLGLMVDLRATPIAAMSDALFSRAQVNAARRRLDAVVSDEACVRSLCATAVQLGIDSLRVSRLALQVARSAAALDGRDRVSEQDLSIAAALVLAPRARLVPQPEEQPPAPAPEPPVQERNESPQNEPGPTEGSLDELVLAAARAALPQRLLDQIRDVGQVRVTASSTGRSSSMHRAAARGRPIGSRPGDPRRGVPLSVVDTLRAAVPWQRLRGATIPIDARATRRVQVRGEDFRVRRFRHVRRTTAIFVVDASGSAAMHRLAEAKGAVELLLAECYVRRDRVALIAFRGRAAELLLPPTRSLTRAKRALAGLPGGGGTPLASGLDAAFAVAVGVQRSGETPLMVVLTDGRVNVARDGRGNRAQAEQDALGAARVIRAARVATLLVDTSPRRDAFAQRVAEALDARYVPLPHADAGQLARAVSAQARAVDVRVH